MFKIRNFCMVVSLVLGFNLNFMHTKVNAQATGVPQNVQVAANVQTTQNTQNEQNKQTLANTNSNENETQQPQISDEKLAEQFKNYMLWDIAFKTPRVDGNITKDDMEVKNQANLSAYQQQAEQLWKKVDEFVKQSDAEGITPENFSDYIVNFLKTKSKPMTTMSKADFEKYIGSGEKIVRLYRGVDKKEFADSFRRGEIFIGGSLSDAPNYSMKSGSSYGHGIYTTQNKSYVRSYMGGRSKMETKESINFQWFDYQEPTGSIIEMAIDESKIKMIEPDSVKQIAKAMLINHAKEFGVLDAFKNFCLANGGRQNMLSYHDILIMGEPFKKTFGVSFLEYVKKKAVQENLDLNTLNLQKIEDYRRYENFQNVMTDFSYDVKNEELCKFYKEISKIFNQNTVKPHYVNKHYACYKDEGLLARLLGYDALVEFNKNRNEKRNFEIEECVVVNPEILTVCNQEDETLFEKPNKSLDEIWNACKERFNH